MKIADFIRDEILLRRLNEREVLVVYDGNGRYRDLCLSLAEGAEADNVRRAVVNAGGSSILAREATLSALQQIGNRELDQLLVYVPAEQSAADEAKLHDPFALAAVCGTVFPNAALDGDEFQQICLRAKPEFSAEIRAIFVRDSNPSFAVIDNIGGGHSYRSCRICSTLNQRAICYTPCSAHRPRNKPGWMRARPGRLRRDNWSKTRWASV
jgi:hypothetical protein